MQEGARKTTLRIWLAIVGTATLVLGASYAMVQQSERLSANEAPLLAALAAKQKISEHIAFSEIVPKEETNLRSEPGVFIIITNLNNKVLATSAVLDDEVPLLPSDFFSDARKNGSDSFTWEPKKGVRLATQVLKYDAADGGYIVAGQSLKETERRLGLYGVIAVTTWLAIVIWTMVLLIPTSQNIIKIVRSKKSSR